MPKIMIFQTAKIVDLSKTKLIRPELVMLLTNKQTNKQRMPYECTPILPLKLYNELQH